MSFPPHLNRPLLPPPGLPPQYAGFPAGAPMIPVHMGIMTPNPVIVSSLPVVSKPPIHRKDPLIRAKDDEAGPTTTVFVGNISEKASDMLIRQLLAKCGIVLSWKRVQGASGKLQAFGFCEYKEPDSTLRALRLLHDMHIGDKNLLVRVDPKTEAQLDEWKAKKKSANGKVGSENGDDGEEVLDEETKKKDQVVKSSIDALMREYADELSAPSQDEDSLRRKRKKDKKDEDDLNTIDMEDDKRDLITREISKFRDTHKKREEEKDKREKERLEFEREKREREKEREREREKRDREKEKERERERERDRERERERDKDRERRTRERDWEGDRSRDKSIARSLSREKSRDREKKRDLDDEEDLHERRRLERKLRDKEAAYQERLKNWELRERKKARDNAKNAEREDERRREMVRFWDKLQMKEGKRLKGFLEDYDDDRDDPKYYRGSALQKRFRDREKEAEADERDRKREKEELEKIRQRLLDEGHPDPDAELRRMEEEEEERLKRPPVIQVPELEEPWEQRHRASREHRGDHRDHRGDHRENHSGYHDRVEHRPHPTHSEYDEVEEGEDDYYEEDHAEVKPCLKPTMRPITAAPSVSSASGNASPNTPGHESPCGIIIPHENSPPNKLPDDENRPKIGLSLKLGASGSPSQPNVSKRKKLPVDSVFGKFEDEEADEQPRKRKLVPLDYDDDKSLGVDGTKGSNSEEKRKHIKSLIEKIPTAKPDLFSYPLDWSMVDTALMERHVRPWINKKIIEYIGEEEPTLVDFVCSKVMAHGTPQGILDDVAMVLDEEAEVFIVKMWRLLIYETEAKKIGLVK
ncbi:RNA-binding protein 25b isoform X1 [Syngnathus scovelli]|uniref:RNA-binding protein 25b isoform X1 n=1 Tax=Syngnathus scovelli TaxID=161590 RepID=UPI00211022F5|nr:RNA-binding protein 25b isoform X1 [Syngnathus scovelli]